MVQQFSGAETGGYRISQLFPLLAAFISSPLTDPASLSLPGCVAASLTFLPSLSLCLFVCVPYTPRNATAGSFVYVHLSGYLNFSDG